MKAIVPALALTLLSSCAPQREAPLTLYDDFAHAQDVGVTTHGELVEGVLVHQGLQPSEITRRQVTLVREETLEHGLDAYIRERFLTPMRGTTRRLEHQAPGVVSQSQGASDSRVVEALYGRKDWRARLERELGVTGEREFLQALCDRVSHVRRTDPQIRQARHELLDAGHDAAEHGVARFLSAGNQGELSRTFARLGVTVDRDFYANYLADPSATIVGAADQGHAAGIASPNAGAMLSAQGVDVESQHDGQVTRETGSSYATPQVARVAREGYRHGIDALGPRLVASAQPVPGAEAYLGAGTLSEEGFWLVR